MRAWSGAAAGLGLITGGAILGAAVTAVWWSPTARLQLPLPVYADATHGGEGFVLATGMIDAGLEGIFVLDTLSGDLSCMVFNPRAGQFNALFERNVLADLQLDQQKRPQFLLVTGQISLGRYQGIVGQPAGCVAYLVEAQSGKFAAYAVPWNSSVFSRGQPQHLPLVLLQVGSVRSAPIR